MSSGGREPGWRGMRLFRACSIGRLILSYFWRFCVEDTLIRDEVGLVCGGRLKVRETESLQLTSVLQPLNSALEACESQQKPLNRIHDPFYLLTTHESLDMAFGKLLRTCAASMAVLGLVTAHGGGVAHQKPLQVDPEADWATRHMAGTYSPISLSSLYHF